MDCKGLAEGGYQKETGVNINARARNNYSSWCNPKGTGKIPAAHRVPGAAVFVHNSSYVSHVGFLWKPVTLGKPEATVVMSSWRHVRRRGTKLNDRGWNRWASHDEVLRSFQIAGAPERLAIYEFGHRELSYGDTALTSSRCRRRSLPSGVSAARGRGREFGRREKRGPVRVSDGEQSSRRDGNCRLFKRWRRSPPCSPRAVKKNRNSSDQGTANRSSKVMGLGSPAHTPVYVQRDPRRVHKVTFGERW
jgi:hypothetical protein